MLYFVIVYKNVVAVIPKVSFNSSPPSSAYMRQETGSALVQVMACRLTAPSHYLSQYWLVVNWTLRNKLHWYFNRQSIICIEENAFENVVCDFPAKLSRGRWVNWQTLAKPATSWGCTPSKIIHFINGYHVSGQSGEEILLLRCMLALSI